MGHVVLRRVQFVGLVAALIGATPGWIGALFLNSEQATVALAAKFHLALFALLPVALYVTSKFDFPMTRQPARLSLRTAFLAEFTVGVIGASIGNLLFCVFSILIPFVFGKMDWEILRQGLFAQIGWHQMATLVGVMAISAFPVARQVG